MTRRMPRHVPHLGFCVEQLEGIAVGDLDIDHRNAVAVRLWTDNDTAGLFLDLGYAADMIVVMMGGQYMSQIPAEHVECLKHGRGIRGVHHGRVAGRAFAQQINIVVRTGGYLMNFERRHRSAPPGG